MSKLNTTAWPPYHFGICKSCWRVAKRCFQATTFAKSDDWCLLEQTRRAGDPNDGLPRTPTQQHIPHCIWLSLHLPSTQWSLLVNSRCFSLKKYLDLFCTSSFLSHVYEHVQYCSVNFRIRSFMASALSPYLTELATASPARSWAWHSESSTSAARQPAVVWYQIKLVGDIWLWLKTESLWVFLGHTRPYPLMLKQAVEVWIEKSEAIFLKKKQN